MESYGTRFKRLFGRALIIAALIVFSWLYWTVHKDQEIREARGVVLGEYDQLKQLDRGD